MTSRLMFDPLVAGLLVLQPVADQMQRLVCTYNVSVHIVAISSQCKSGAPCLMGSGLTDIQ